MNEGPNVSKESAVSSTPLAEIVPNLTSRATPSVGNSVPLFFGATILGERRIDSLAVMDDGKLGGELRFLDVLRYVYRLRDTQETPQDLIKVEVKETMFPKPNLSNSQATLRDLLGLIEASRTASVFITDGSRLLGHVSLTDILRWIIRSKPKLNIKAVDMATKMLVSAPLDASFEEIVQLMLDRYVRKIVLMKDEKVVGIIDDRGVTNMIFGSQYNKTDYKTLFGKLVKEQVVQVDAVEGGASIRDAAVAVLRNVNQCVFVSNDGIVTPWDVGIKSLRRIK